MKSISEKILKFTLFWLGLVIVLLTAVSIIVVTRISNTDSVALISQVCEKETLRFNNEFTLLENSVTTISEYVEDLEKECTTEEELLSDTFCDKVQEMTLSIANRTDGAMAVYFRYNPELTGNGTQGFFWSRDNDEEDFSYFTPTDILRYDQDDTEHVGWFYEPKKNHAAMWMSPYYNKNLDVFMISYIIPYYTENGDFLGVIGMDIDFNKIVGLTSKVSLYETGNVYLIDLSTHYIYDTDEEGNVQSDNLSTELYNHVTTIAVNQDILEMTENDRRYLTGMGQLSNGMRLLLMVPVREINANRNNMLLIFAGIMAISLICAVFFIVRFTNKMVYPLKVLTEITGAYAEGNWDETYISSTGDEIQQLSESISVMAETTKSYINTIHVNAMTDALTGLKNRNCYLAYIDRYQKQSTEDPEHPVYGVVVLDINFLKKVNDNFGHEAGDELIKEAGRYICQIYDHSPVFRIGGDEYAVILENSDYENREELAKQFVAGMKDHPPVIGEIPFAISYGMATYPEDGAGYDEVFTCADERMYAYKIMMKAERS